MKKYYHKIFVVAIIVLFLYSCASIVVPEGGPKDITPPQIKESIPENYTTNFKEKKIFIKFDEFIQLKNADNKLIVSPPLEEKPKLMVKGKTFVVDINNVLKDSTTYTFNFGDAVADITEGNAESNFQFIFSTGDFLDSLEISGTVTDAYSLEKQRGILVMLYTDFSDSVPLKERPYYITKTDDQGFFKIKCIKTGTYKLFALSDANNNYLFDLPNEKIAFIDSLITPLVKWDVHYDTIPRIDSTITDSLLTDSIVADSFKVYYPDPIDLVLFEEDHQTQYLASNQREKRFKVAFYFNKPLYDSLVEVSEINGHNNDLIYEMSTKYDSLTVWITDSLLYNKDTTIWTITYLVKDSIEHLIRQTDTLNLVYYEPGKKNKQTMDTLLRYNLNITGGGILDFEKDVRFMFDNPIELMDTQLISLYEYKDSIAHRISYELIRMEDHYRDFRIHIQYKEDTRYRLEVLPGAFKDYYDLTTDTVELDFTIQRKDHYGSMKLKISDIDASFIIYLMDESENILKTLKGTGTSEFELLWLPPKKYKFKAIIDSNDNGEWDSGNYLKKIQPEKVLYYPEDIEVKSNWDMELEWILNQLDK